MSRGPDVCSPRRSTACPNVIQPGRPLRRNSVLRLTTAEQFLLADIAKAPLVPDPAQGRTRLRPLLPQLSGEWSDGFLLPLNRLRSLKRLPSPPEFRRNQAILRIDQSVLFLRELYLVTQTLKLLLAGLRGPKRV